MAIDLTWIDLAIRLGAAVLLGGLAGWERESRGKGAGLKTHIMVGVGAAGFTLTGLQFASSFSVANGEFFRVLAGVIGGVGFLGGGAIIQSQGSVKGLTTAAGLWVVAAMGMACGGGYFQTALLLIILVLFTFFVGRLIEKRAIHRTSRTRSESRE